MSFDDRKELAREIVAELKKCDHITACPLGLSEHTVQALNFMGSLVQKGGVVAVVTFVTLFTTGFFGIVVLGIRSWIKK